MKLRAGRDAATRTGHLQQPRFIVTPAKAGAKARRKTANFEALEPFVPAFAGMTKRLMEGTNRKTIQKVKSTALVTDRGDVGQGPKKAAPTTPPLSIQPKGNMAKPYQIDQFLDIVDEFGLKMDE